MKKLLLILTIGLIGFGSALSLEPINITFKASPTYAANSTVDNVYITLSDKTGIKFTSQERDGVLVDDSGIITIKIGLFNGTEQTAWDNIDANSLNSFSVLEARIGGPTVTPFTQVRIDAQIINQTSTSVFINGNLVPQNPTSTLGTDNERFAGAYILGSSVHIGAADGEANDSELVFGYTDSLGVNSGYGFGTVTVNGTESARFYDNRFSLEQNSLVNTPLIDNAGGITINGDNNAAITLAGAVTANRAANTIGNGADATQLTISGIETPSSPGPYVFELSVQGDAEVTGFLQINGLSLLGDLDLNNNDIFDVNEIRGRDPLQADPNTLRINDSNDGAVIFGDGAVTVGNGNLTVGDGNTSFGTGTFTKGTGQSTFNGNVDAALGLDVTGADLTVATPALFSVNGSTGVLTSTAPANTFGDGNDVAQLTINGDTAGAAYDFVVNGDADLIGDVHIDETLVVVGTSNLQGAVDADATLNVDGNTTLNANITLGDANTDDINVPGEFVSNLVPNTNNANSLGTDAQRWSDVFVSGASVHIGDANGAANSNELAIRYNGSNVGSIAVGDGSSNANPQFTINATAELLSLDPAADGQSNFVFTEGLMSVNTGAGTNLVLNEDGFVKTAGVDTEFSFTNPSVGANLNVTIDGDLDVAEQITAPNVGHSFGTSGTDATVVTINGDVAGAAYELVVNGDADILGDAHIDQTLVVVGTIDGQTFGNTIGNSSDNTQLTINGDATGAAFDLVVTGDAQVTGDVDINQTLQVDGTANVDGIFTATAAGNSIGATTDATQLTINGVVGGANDFIVTGDAQTTGSLDVDGNLNVDGTSQVDGTSNVDGIFTATAAGNSIGATTDATQLTINGVVGGANDFIVTGDAQTTGSLDVDATLNVDGNTTLNANVALGDDLATDLTTFSSKVNSNIIANASTFGLGTNAERWGHAYVLGNSVHVGPANGEGSTELAIGYASNSATFNVDGATQAQLQINALSDNVVINPDGSGLNSYSFRTAGLEIDNGAATTNLVISESGISRNSVSNETFTFVNPDVTSTLNVIVEGTSNLQGNVDANSGVDVTGAALTVGSPALFSVDGTTGVLTSTADGNSIGNIANNTTKLTINGVAGGANELVVTGDIQATGNVDVDTDLNVDGNTVLNGNTTLGNLATADVVTFNSRVATDINPSVDNTVDLGTPALRWNDINLGGNATVGGQARIVEAGGPEYVGFQAPALAANTVYTLPDAFPVANGQALISSTTGTLSWGGVSLQSAYNAGNTINTDNGVVGNQNIVFTGTGEVFDIQLNMTNSTSAPVQVNDAEGFIVNSGLLTASNGLTVGSGGLTTINGGVLIQTNDVNITSDVEINGDLLSDGKVTLGGGTAATNVSLAGVVSQTVGGTIGSLANVIVLGTSNNQNFTPANLNAGFVDGTVVHLYVVTGSNSDFTDNNSNTETLNGGEGITLVKAAGQWYIIGTNN